MRKYLKSSQSILNSFLRVYVPATIAVCTILFLFSYYTVRSFREQAYEHYAWYSEIMRDEFDNALTTIYGQSYTFKNNSDILSYAINSDKSSNTAIYAAHGISRLLQNRNSLFHDADTFFLYLYSDDTIISNSGRSSCPVYYDGQELGSEEGFAAWHTAISERVKSLRLEYCAETGQVIMISPLSNHTGNIVAALDMTLVSARWLNTLPSGSFFLIRNNDGSVFYSSAGGESEPAKLPEVPEASEESWINDGADHVLFPVKSSSYAWTYYLSIPESMVYQTNNIWITLIILFAVILIYIVLIVLQMYATNYRPLKVILQMLEKSHHTGSSDLKNEYEIIEKSFHQVLSDNTEITKTLHNLEQTMAEYMLSDLIEGNISPDDAEWFQRFSVVCPELSQRKIVLMTFRNCTRVELVGDFYEKFLSLPSIQKAMAIYCVPVDNTNVFFMGVTEPGMVRKMESEMQALLTRINASRQKKMVCVISSCQKNCTKIPEAYQELLTLNVPDEAEAGCFVYSYDSAKGTPSSDTSFRKSPVMNTDQLFSFTLQEDFSRLIQQRQFGEAEKIARLLIDNVMQSGLYAPLESARSAIFLLLNREFSSSSEEAALSAEEGQRKNGEETLLCSVLLAQTPEALANAAAGCIEHIPQEESMSPQRHTNNLLISDICTFIQKNFQDSTLNVSEIARQFHLSMPYLSKLFKDVTGYNVLEYLYLVRLKYAKIQLRETIKSISCIAQESGFKDAKRLTQLIKKYEGTTPGQYRREP